jgi:hypothetical protein
MICICVFDLLKGEIRHKKSTGMLQPLPEAQWKWECIIVDFMCGFPISKNQKDVVWEIVDRLTKTAHFILVNM